MVERRLLSPLIQGVIRSRTCYGLFVSEVVDDGEDERPDLANKTNYVKEIHSASPPSFEKRSRHIELPCRKSYHTFRSVSRKITAVNVAAIFFATEKAPAINGGFGDFIFGRNDET